MEDVRFVLRVAVVAVCAAVVMGCVVVSAREEGRVEVRVEHSPSGIGYERLDQESESDE